VNPGLPNSLLGTFGAVLILYGALNLALIPLLRRLMGSRAPRGVRHPWIWAYFVGAIAVGLALIGLTGWRL
jgi:Na+-transporting NADH:ubiquinone oxidoreductase subunit NqrB